MGEQAVAEQDADGVAPLGIRSGLSAPDFRAVHDIVINQRGGVDQLQHHGQVDMAGADVPRRSPRQQSESGAQTFSPAFAGVRYVSLNARIEFPGLLLDSFLHAVEMSIDEIECLLDLPYCARSSPEIRQILHTVQNRKLIGKVNAQ